MSHKTALISVSDDTPIKLPIKNLGWLIFAVASSTAAGVAGWLHLAAKTDAANEGVKILQRQVGKIEAGQSKDHDLIVKIDGGLQTLVDMERARFGANKTSGVTLTSGAPSDSARIP